MNNLSFKSPNSSEEWESYHQIRKEVLWEARGRFGVYDSNHPDEYVKGNYPKILFVAEDPVGVIRIDLRKETDQAIFRRVAVVGTEQRKGFGKKLMSFAEEFASSNGVRTFAAYVSRDAVGFYQKIGYCFDLDDLGDDPGNLRMIKIGESNQSL